MAKKLDIGGELHSVATDHKVADASEIKDISKGNKSQTAFNNDVDRHEVEIHGTGGIDSRLTDVEQIEQIVLDGGEAQIAQGSDFTNPDATKRAKVPTVGAIVDGLNDGVYDVSKRNPTAGPNSDGKFTLEYILSNADTLIPTGWRHGGMTISFVHSSDNIYVQYRYMGTATTGTPNPFLDTANWQGVDDVPTAGSDNIVKSGGVYNNIEEEKRQRELSDNSIGTELNDTKNKINFITKLQELGLYVTDTNGNVGFKIVEGLVDALGFGSNLTQVIKDLIGENVDFSPINEAIEALSEELTDSYNLLKEKTDLSVTVEQDGLYLIDSRNNIGWHFRPRVTEDEGVYFIDENKNIGFSIINGKFDFSGFGDATVNWLKNYLHTEKTENTAESAYRNSDSNYADMARLHAEIEESVNSLTTLKDATVDAGDIVTRTVTIPASTSGVAVTNGIIRLGLHYGSCSTELSANKGNLAVWDEVYFNGKCRKDFSDIRVFDSNGNMLPVYMLHHGNYEVCPDNAFYNATLLGDSNGNLYSGNLVSSDNGTTWDTFFTLPGAKPYAIDLDGNFYLFATSAQNSGNSYSPDLSVVPGDIIKVPYTNNSYNFSTASVVCQLSYNNYYYHAAITINGTATENGTLVLQASPCADYINKYSIAVTSGMTAAEICAAINDLDITEWTTAYTDGSNSIILNSAYCKVYIEPAIEGGVSGLTYNVAVTKDGATREYPIEMRRHYAIYERNGHKYMLFGSYQEPTNTLIKRSVDGGAFEEVLTNQIKYDVTGRNAQHTHFIGYDAAHGILYAGLDHAANGEYGPTVLKSYDNGTTWEDLKFTNEEVRTDANAQLWQNHRSRDMTPSWYSSDGKFSIGGGETNVLGGYTLVRVDNSGAANDVIKTDKIFKSVVNNGGGIRAAINDLGDDFIVAPLVAGYGVTTAQLILSTDKGNTWQSIWQHEDPMSKDHVGNGPRFSCHCTPVGDEEQLIFTGASEDDKYSPLRIYKGGNHYYGEILVKIGNIPSEGTILSVTNGYAMKQPKKLLFNRECTVEPIYSIKFDQGIGNTVTDSEGNTGVIVGDYEWTTEPLCFGNYVAKITPYNKGYGLKLGIGSYINFGKISKLDFTRGYTVVLISNQNFKGNVATNEHYYAYSPIMTFGTFGIYNWSAGVVVGRYNGAKVYIRNNGAGGTMGIPYVTAIRVGSDNIEGTTLPNVMTRINQKYFDNSRITYGSNYDYTNLSTKDLIVGSPNKEIDDNLVYNDPQISYSEIRIYNRELTDAEVDSIIFGYTRRLEQNY